MATARTRNPETVDSSLEQRVLIVAPVGRDAELLCGILHHAGIEAAACETLEQLCREVENGAAAAIVAEEVLTGNSRQVLIETMQRQPEWSDFPLVVMATAGSLPERRWQFLGEANGLGREDQKPGFSKKPGSWQPESLPSSDIALTHLILLERPVRKAILLSAVQAALLSRNRQYQVRRELRRRRSAERELRESEEQRRVALAAGRMGTWMWEIQSDTVTGDDMHRALWNLDSNENPVPREVILDRVHPEDLGCFYSKERAAELSGPLDMEFRVIRRDGEVRWLKASAMPLPDKNGVVQRLIGVNFDITQQKQYEQRLLEADRHKDDFIAILAHELRNPLAPIRNATQVFELVDLGNDTLVEMRDVIKRQVEHMARLLDDLLDVSRIARGKVELKRERVELCELVRTTAEDFRGTLSERGIALLIRVSDELFVFDADPTRLAQCIGNLLQNACKFTEEGGSVLVLLTHEAGRASITVRDDGVGMDPEFTGHLFQPFRQADRSLHRSPGGLGLGLAMVKGLVELHGGRVYAESEGVGKGASFTIHLPLEATS